MNLKNTLQYKDVSINTAALVAGLVIFIPTAPFAEFVVYHKLIMPGNISETIK